MALAKEYENAKGTSEEIAKQVELKMKMDEVEAWSDSCARQKDSFRFYGMVFSGVAFVALFPLVLGLTLTIWGFLRKKKLA